MTTDTVPNAVKKQLKKAEERQAKIRDKVEEPELNLEVPEPAAEEEAPAKQEEPGIAIDKSSAVQSPDQWEQRYKALKGKYDKEVPTLMKENSQLQKQNRFLQEKMMQMEENQEIEQPKPQANATQKFSEFDPSKYVTDEEKEEYGEDYIKMQGRVTKAMIEESLAPLLNKLKSVDDVAQKSVYDVFLERVVEQVPDFEEVNNDERFIDWLQQPDGYSGQTLQDSLDLAVNSRNSKLVVKIFNDWKSENGKEVKRSLGNQIAPSGSTASKPPPDSAKGRIWKASEIREIANDIVKGKISPKKAQDLQVEWNKALASGRVEQN